MRIPTFKRRPGTTLIELLIYLAVLGMVIATALPLLFSATENRLLQQTISAVEQNGTQVIQNSGLYIRQAERIISPAMGQTGSVLVLQTASGATNPTILGYITGSVIVARGNVAELISSSQVAVQNFIVRNTSVSPTNQSVSITFRVSRTIRLQAPHSYAQTFEGTYHLFNDDIEEGNTCQCNAPSCLANNVYQWQYCQVNNCLTAKTQLKCP